MINALLSWAYHFVTNASWCPFVILFSCHLDGNWAIQYMTERMRTWWQSEININFFTSGEQIRPYWIIEFQMVISAYKASLCD